MNLQDTYNTIAEDWVKDHDRDSWWQEGTDYFLSLLPKNSNILDVGCGGGIKTRYILSKGYRAMGIDFSDKMIEIAQRENPKVEFKVLDIYDIDTLEETFDGIFVQAVLLHIPKARVLEVLTKMKKKLNPNGLLYIAVKGIRDDGIEEDVKIENDYGYEYERFFSYFSLSELKGYLEQLGLTVVWEGSKDSNQTNWVQIIGKRVS
jgi:SAM-dependent methyltransferase